MPHSCELCGTELGPRARVCRVCGKKVGEALPVRPGRNRRGIAGMACKGIAVMALTGMAYRGASALWMRGAGGEIAFRQHNRAGNQAFERGDFSAADAEYSEMIALRPRKVDGYLLRAINDYKAGQFPQAIRDNTAALALTRSPMSRSTLLFNRAESYFNKRAWAEAIADYTLAEQADQQAAQEPGAYTEDLQRLPGWMADARRGRARASIQLKQYARVVADYSANIKAGYILPEEYGMRGAAEEGLGKDAEAIADYGRAICVDPGYLYAYQKLDAVDKRTRRDELVADAYRQAAQAHPDNVLCYGSLGWYEHEAGHYGAAIAADERALSLDPAQGWIRCNLGLSCAVSGDSAGASKAYARGLQDQDPARRTAVCKEIQDALARHPGSAALQAALRQVQTAIAANPAKPAAGAASSDARPAPIVDPAFERLLSADTARNGYAIRPPAGYALKQTRAVTLSGGQDTDLWRGAARPDGSAPDLQVLIIADDGRIAAQASPRQLMQRFLNGLTENHTQFKASAITPCTMGMRTFMRTTWSGVGTKTGRQFSGIVYIASQTGEYICIEVHDSSPHSAASLPLLDASARTFRR